MLRQKNLTEHAAHPEISYLEVRLRLTKNAQSFWQEQFLYTFCNGPKARKSDGKNNS